MSRRDAHSLIQVGLAGVDSDGKDAGGQPACPSRTHPAEPGPRRGWPRPVGPRPSARGDPGAEQRVRIGLLGCMGMATSDTSEAAGVRRPRAEHATGIRTAAAMAACGPEQSDASQAGAARRAWNRPLACAHDDLATRRYPSKKGYTEMAASITTSSERMMQIQRKRQPCRDG